MKITFFGTPEYVVPIFEHLVKYHDIVCVVTRDDKPSGRHLELCSSPIKKTALEKNICVLTPNSLKNNDFTSKLSTFNSQLGVAVAYGKILPKEILETFPLGCINLHFSLLPKYRGAAPIQWAIINGENETGVTSFFMDECLDTGKIISQTKIAIDIKDTTNTLREKLILTGINVLDKTIELIKNGKKGIAQTGQPTYAPPLSKENGKIDWGKTAEEIHNLIRGTKPWPGAYTTVQKSGTIGEGLGIRDSNLKIVDAEVSQSSNFPISQSITVGTIVSIEKNIGFVVKCGNDFLVVKTVQPASKNVMSAWAFLLGHKLSIGDKLC